MRKLATYDSLMHHSDSRLAVTWWLRINRRDLRQAVVEIENISEGVIAKLHDACDKRNHD